MSKGVRTNVFNGALLTKLRQEHGYSQEELAAQLGTGAAQVHRYEKGITEPSLTVALRLKKILGVLIDDLVVDPDRTPDAEGTITARSETERSLIRAFRSGDLREALSLLSKK